MGRLELDRTHAAGADVAEALNDVEARGLTPLGGQPGVDERGAPAVGQRVGRQPGEAAEGILREARKAVGLLAARHPDRRDLDPAAGEGRVVLEGGVARAGTDGDGADPRPPQHHRRDRHRPSADPSPHIHGASPGSGRVRPRRPRAGTTATRALLPLQLGDRQVNRLGQPEIEPGEQPERPQELDHRGHLHRLSPLRPLHRREPEAGFCGHLGLGPVALEAVGLESVAELGEDGGIGHDGVEAHQS